MENWQLALVILVAVLVGASIPAFILMFSVLYRAGKEIAEIGKRLRPTLSRIEIISERVETLSRGLEGGEKNIADLLAATGELARGLERNMKIINISAALIASVGPAVAAFVRTMRQPNEPESPHTGDACACAGDDRPRSSSSASTEPTQEAQQRNGREPA